MGLAYLAEACRKSLGLGRAAARRAEELERWRQIAKKVRLFASYRFIRGSGIEIGALNQPLKVYHGATVRYLDRLPTEQLRATYPAVAGERLVDVDHLDDAETLSSIADESCDFVIANHMIEHLRNPIGAIGNMLRVLKSNGIVYMAVPDKRFTFDRDRAVTTYEHLRRDYFESPDWSDAEHYRDWVTRVGKFTDESQATQQSSYMQGVRDDIHFHVWTQREFIELILHLRRDFHFPIEIEALMKNAQEFVVVLRKADLG